MCSNKRRTVISKCVAGALTRSDFLISSTVGEDIPTLLLVYSDYKGWSCLHHAASEGYTQTMEILLSTNPKLLDKIDEDGV